VRQQLQRWHGLSRTRQLLIILGAVLAVAPAPLAVAAQTHVVQPGETLSAIADQYGISLADLVAANGVADPDVIFAGETLKIDTPAATVSVPDTSHAVVEGDTLAVIAGQYGVSVEALVQANGLADANFIYIGQVLAVPAPARISTSVVQARGKAALQAAESEFRLPPGILLALAWQESGWNQNMVSDAGAIGITQVLPETAEWAVPLLVPDATDWNTSAADNARLGAALLRYYLDASGGNLRISIGAYYQGWASVEQRGLLEETAVYVGNVLSLQRDFS
jgi:N-acetylmuramoyl-L-alanine amidase